MRAIVLGLTIGALAAGTAAAADMSAAEKPLASAGAANLYLIEKSANDFYAAVHALKGEEANEIPAAKTRAKLGPFISPDLAKLFAAADEAEQEYAKKTKGEVPPLVEGDPYSSNFEGVSSYKIGDCSGDAQKAKCPVALTYVDQSAKPLEWTDTAAFVMTEKGWRLDDIAYGGKWSFGHHGTLRELLKWVAEESKKPVD